MSLKCAPSVGEQLLLQRRPGHACNGHLGREELYRKLITSSGCPFFAYSSVCVPHLVGMFGPARYCGLPCFASASPS